MNARFACSLGVFAALLAGCTEDATQIVVAVGTDMRVPDELGFVRVARCTLGTMPPAILSPACRFHDFDLRSGQSIPFSLTLAANDDHLDEVLTVIVAGYASMPTEATEPVAARVTDTQFRAHQTLGLPITLFRDCPVMCVAGASSPACCGNIAAVPVSAGRELDLLDGGVRPPRLDGGGACESDDDCDDGMACTDDHCIDGACGESTMRACADEDGNECTLEACDEGTGECAVTDATDGTDCGSGDDVCCSGACTDTDVTTEHCGACDMACDTNESCTAGRCECGGDFAQCGAACVSLATPMNCGACGNVCSGATPACLGATCGACATADDCPAEDPRTCLTGAPTCVAGACVYTIASGACLIDEECADAGDRNPDNDCEECDPARADDAWSNRDGEACDDGMFCTTGTTCDRARCTGATPLACDDTLSCTNDSCDETTDSCVNQVRSGCAIDGACYAARARNPDNQCEECDPSAPDGWSLAIGGVCDDDVVCTIDDTCQPDGSCDGDPNPCDDMVACTDDSCNATADACEHTLQPDKCNVSGTCYDAGAAASGNTCATCDPTRSTTVLSPVAEETGCMPGAGMMGGGHCCGGVCQPLNSTSNCLTCGNVCPAGQMCGIYGMTPPDFRCCTTCPPPP